MSSSKNQIHLTVFREIDSAKSESDNYGYSEWLAKHLNVRFQRTSVGFQHGWIWWDIQDCPLPAGIDPNWKWHSKILTQDETIRDGVIQLGKKSVACGLPFLNYFDHGRVPCERIYQNLYIPAHSNSSMDRTRAIFESIKSAKDKYKDCAILLAYCDRKLEPEIKDWFERVEIGAGDLEANSFERMAKIFQQYETAITDVTGSHVLYARWAGMKVGLDVELFQNSIRNGLSFRHDTFTPEYINNRYPGLVVDGNDPVLWKLPNIATATPREIAEEFGWELICQA